MVVEAPFSALEAVEVGRFHRLLCHDWFRLRHILL